jgi:hypothetical protein
MEDTTMSGTELDLDDARRRLAAAAEDAKRHEERGEGWAAMAAWKRYEMISAAIEAQARSERAAGRR